MSQTMIRPEQVASLPMLDATQKQQYRVGLSGLWQQFENAPNGSPQKNEVKQKIITASHRIMQQISQRSKPMAGNQQRMQNGQAGGDGASSSMPMAQQQSAQGNQQRMPQQPNQPQHNPQQSNDPDQAIKERITIEVNRLVVAPQESCTNQAQYELYKANFKTQLGSIRFKLEKAKQNEAILQRQLAQMQQMGQQPSDDLQQKLPALRNAIQTYTQQATNLVTTNERNTELAQARKNQNNQNRPDQPPRPPTQPGVANQQDANSPAQRPPTAQAPQRPNQTPVQQPQRPAQPGQPGQQPYPQQYPAAPNSAAPQNAAQAQRPHALSRQGAIAKAQEHNNQQSAANHPQGATTQNGMPFNQPQPQNTPTSAVPQAGQHVNSKFPIPKNLSLGPQTQTAVASAPARPTIGHSGMMSVPGIQKVPQFTLEGEGDHVMSSRKLYDIVRQVTGSTDPADGLAPDVEEAVLSLTDNFVDDVITKACQLAKLRQGSALDIRDIQIVLERGYGLRIPGYSLDETRATRRFNPSAGWVSKIQAVQASKLTKGE